MEVENRHASLQIGWFLGYILGLAIPSEKRKEGDLLNSNIKWLDCTC